MATEGFALHACRRPANVCVYQKPQEDHLDRQHSIPQRAHSFPRGSTRATNGAVLHYSHPLASPRVRFDAKPAGHHSMAIPLNVGKAGVPVLLPLKGWPVSLFELPYMAWLDSRACFSSCVGICDVKI